MTCGRRCGPDLAAAAASGMPTPARLTLLGLTPGCFIVHAAAWVCVCVCVVSVRAVCCCVRCCVCCDINHAPSWWP